MTGPLMVKTPMTRCRGCKKAVESWGNGEVWHEECYQEHRAEKPKCEAHKCCAQEMQRRKDASRAVNSEE